MTSWRIAVDPARCLGAGMCAAAASHRFRLVDGYSQPLAERIPPDPAVVDAADLCPVEAILVEEEPT